MGHEDVLYLPLDQNNRNCIQIMRPITQREWHKERNYIFIPNYKHF